MRIPKVFGSARGIFKRRRRLYRYKKAILLAAMAIISAVSGFHTKGSDPFATIVLTGLCVLEIGFVTGGLWSEFKAGRKRL